MAYEIERRYLVRFDEDRRGDLPDGWSLRQGYVRNGTPSVRIRTGEPRGNVLTCKSGEGVKRQEAETVVPDDVAEALFLAAEKRVIEKTRYPIGPWELDEFGGDLEGLWLMEVELEAEDDAVPDPPAGVEILREVTDDKRFVSGHLARMNKGAKRKLVKKVYREVEGG